MKALITGIAGFAGAHLAEFLLTERNLEVSGIEIPGCKTENIGAIRAKIKLYRCDIRRDSAVLKIIRDSRPDFIFHLAAQTFVPDSWVSPSVSLSTNIIGTLNIFEAVRKLKANTRVQVACSSEEYGRVYKHELPVKETNELRPLNPYAVSKVAQDMLGYQYSQSYGMFIVRTRAFNHIGPGLNAKFVAANFAQQIALIENGRKKPVIYTGNLDAVRDFSDVRDIVRAYWLSLKNGHSGEAYNICSGQGHRIAEILDILLRYSGKAITVETAPERLRPSEVKVLYGDSSKFRSHTKWVPEIPFKQSLRDILEYWRDKTKND